VRILLVDSGRALRGGQWQTLYLAEGLYEAGGEVRLLARAGTPLFQWTQAGGYAPEDATASNMRQSGRWADVVHVQDARSHTLAALWCRKPIVVSRRVAFAVKRGPASRWKYGRASAYIAVSKYVGRMLEEAGIPTEKVNVVHDGVPRPAAQVETQDARAIPLLGLRTGDRAKGDDLLVAAAQLARADVHWTEDLVADLPKTRVFGYITRSEGLGSAALLAMANGAVVVASRTGGLEEVVEHETTGLLTENEPEAIAAALRRVLDDRALAARLASAGCKRASERFSVERMVRETVEVYRKVVA
jgi:hypothetical protein